MMIDGYIKSLSPTYYLPPFEHPPIMEVLLHICIYLSLYIIPGSGHHHQHHCQGAGSFVVLHSSTRIITPRNTDTSKYGCNPALHLPHHSYMRRRRMAAISLGDPRVKLHTTGRSPPHHHHGVVVEEIDGLIRAYKDGYVERFHVVPDVPCTWSPDPDVVSRDVVVDPSTRLWARLYAPAARQGARLPVLVYFHGGGFCVGSAAWSCYHEFLSRLASRAGCLVMSVNYRLAPEQRLPAAFDDGLAAVRWLGQQAVHGGEDARWWWGRGDHARVFLGGDSAGAAVAHNVAAQIASQRVPVAPPRGVILIQPFFGGEARTASERNSAQPPGSALSLVASDAYWRLALPPGSTRDHPWCNPLAGGGAARLRELALPPYFVCISELDILKDRDMEFCRAMRRAGKSVESVVHAGVGHAFQVLNGSRASQSRAQEMISQLSAFLGR